MAMVPSLTELGASAELKVKVKVLHVLCRIVLADEMDWELGSQVSSLPPAPKNSPTKPKSSETSAKRSSKSSIYLVDSAFPSDSSH